MRIIAGQFGGRSFHPPSEINARPTTDRAKEALFNTLHHQKNPQDLSVLDLFSGTGNIAYEMASRMAVEITAVDKSHHSIRFIKNTMKDLGYTSCQAIKSDVFSFLKSTKSSYDIIFADPPYSLPGIPRIVDLVFERNLLKRDGLLIVEHFQSLRFPQEQFVERRAYGQSVFSWFR